MGILKQITSGLLLKTPNNFRNVNVSSVNSSGISNLSTSWRKTFRVFIQNLQSAKDMSCKIKASLKEQVCRVSKEYRISARKKNSISIVLHKLEPLARIIYFSDVFEIWISYLNSGNEHIMLNFYMSEYPHLKVFDSILGENSAPWKWFVLS